MDFFGGIRQMFMGNAQGTRPFAPNACPDRSCGMNDSLFGCNSMSAVGGMETFNASYNNGFDACGIGSNGNIKPFMQMLGAMFGQACGYQGLDLLKFMNNWSKYCDNMGLNTVQGLTNAYQKAQTKNAARVNSLGVVNGFGTMSGISPMGGIYGPYLGATNEGERLAQIASCAGGQNGTRGKCLKGVNDSLQAAYGFRLSYPSAYMAKQSLDRMGDKFQNVTCQYQPASKLKSLPPGAIVVWDRKEGHPHGHISIALGNGQEASDHIQNQITGYGSSYVVYMPKDGSCPA